VDVIKDVSKVNLGSSVSLPVRRCSHRCTCDLCLNSMLRHARRLLRGGVAEQAAWVSRAWAGDVLARPQPSSPPARLVAGEWSGFAARALVAPAPVFHPRQREAALPPVTVAGGWAQQTAGLRTGRGEGEGEGERGRGGAGAGVHEQQPDGSGAAGGGEGEHAPREEQVRRAPPHSWVDVCPPATVPYLKLMRYAAHLLHPPTVLHCHAQVW
jgi:hypothetical protein